jgi:hypothetical protein
MSGASYGVALNRAHLIALARRVGVNPVVSERTGKGVRQAPLSSEGLRIALLERCYGPRLGTVKVKTARELDERISRVVSCRMGELGYLLSLSQSALRNGNAARDEAIRISNLKRPRKADIAAQLSIARNWYALANTVQNLHLIEVGMQDGIPSDYRESLFEGANE